MENLDTKNNQRNPMVKKDSVDEEVQKLFRKSGGKINQHEFQNLRNKYGNEELVEKIQRAFIEKHTDITKKANKFAQLIREKYADDKHPFHVLLDKAYKYKVKHGLTDDEFSEFQRIYENALVGLKSAEVFAPNTNVTRLLGNMNVNLQGFNDKLSDSDYKILQEILKLHATSKPLHAQVMLQSMQYEDCSIEAVTGKYERNIHNVANHIHPVIAALFLPRLDVLEKHFLHSNLANIVKTRYNNEAFTNAADIELFWAISKDPNDIVCDNRSTLADLHTRALLQNQIWNAVLSLRNGQYYNSSFREFISTIDVCRLNRQDTPDLVYGRYDGTIIKRLLSAFSFRPTVVATMPIYQIFSTNPYQQNIRPTVTYVPMINLKLPPSLTESDPVDLDDALEQQQYFLENGTIVPKHTSLIYSRGVLFFFVDRRATVIHTINTINPFSMSNLPLAASGFERINEREVNYKPILKIRNDLYNLRSVVVSEVNNKIAQTNIVVGSSTAIMVHPDSSKGIYTPEYLLYDPYTVVDAKLMGGTALRNDPITPIEGFNVDPNVPSFTDMVRKRGIIFMYQLVKDDSNGSLTF
jgi:hypothetical protein